MPARGGLTTFRYRIIEVVWERFRQFRGFPGVRTRGGEEHAEISRFLGIIIAMYYSDHNPPHFHVKYNEYRALFSIGDLKILEGELPPKVIALVLEWAFANRDELMEDWQLATSRQPLKSIKPLV